MRKILIIIAVLFLLPVRVHAMEFEPPEAPDSAQEYMPEETESFAEGLWSIITDGIKLLQPALAEAAGICAGAIAAVLLLSLTQNLSGMSEKTTQLVGTIVVSTMLFSSSNALVQLGVSCIEQVSDYGKLLLPVMTSALAAQGGTTTSAALYTGTAFFDTLLSACISNILTPMIYIYLCLAIANSATGESVLVKLRDFVKWLMTWILKIILYVFTGYMGITGVVSGSTDAAAMKATKLTVSGAVPVVGGILADASEAILVSAGVMKSAVGVYGLLAISAMWVEPFLRIGVQYLLLKLTAAVCGVFGSKQVVGLIQNFSAAMGLLLAMTGAVCLMLMISIVCFMKGVS